MIDLTPVFQAIIALLAAIITYKLIPWIKSKCTENQLKQLRIAADIAVYAAEQLFGAGCGAEKLEYALGILEHQGFKVDDRVLRAAIEDAVYQMVPKYDDNDIKPVAHDQADQEPAEEVEVNDPDWDETK